MTVERSGKPVVVTITLDGALKALRSHEGELHRLGVSHAAVFGSVARGEATDTSDVDVLVELDDGHPMGIFEYARLKKSDLYVLFLHFRINSNAKHMRLLRRPVAHPPGTAECDAEGTEAESEVLPIFKHGEFPFLPRLNDNAGNTLWQSFPSRPKTRLWRLVLPPPRTRAGAVWRLPECTFTTAAAHTGDKNRDGHRLHR